MFGEHQFKAGSPYKVQVSPKADPKCPPPIYVTGPNSPVLPHLSASIKLARAQFASLEEELNQQYEKSIESPSKPPSMPIVQKGVDREIIGALPAKNYAEGPSCSFTMKFGKL